MTRDSVASHQRKGFFEVGARRARRLRGAFAESFTITFASETSVAKSSASAGFRNAALNSPARARICETRARRSLRALGCPRRARRSPKRATRSRKHGAEVLRARPDLRNASARFVRDVGARDLRARVCFSAQRRRIPAYDEACRLRSRESRSSSVSRDARRASGSGLRARAAPATNQAQRRRALAKPARTSRAGRRAKAARRASRRRRRVAADPA
jgi:hypothetical protein